MTKIKSEKKAPFVITKITRYISIRLAMFLSRYPITPNQITYASFALAVAAFLFFSMGKFQFNIMGMLLFIFSYILDFVDGDLARVKKQTSRFGDWIDAVLGKIGCVLLFLGICIGQSKHHLPSQVWFLGFIAISGYYVSQSLIHKNTILSLELKLNPSEVVSKPNKARRTNNNNMHILRRIAKDLFIGGHFILYMLFIAVLLDKMILFLYFSAIYMWLDHILQIYFNIRKFSY